MKVHIDWLSFTMPHQSIGDGGGVYDPANEFQTSLDLGFGKAVGLLDAVEDWQPGTGRAPYTETSRSSIAGISFYSSSQLSNMLCEVAGTGCDFLRASNAMTYILSRNLERITRLDIACDIETDCSPTEFADTRSGKRFKSKGDFISESGHTVYIGSRKSDRYARVYRYFAPHPRSHLLRVEMVVRDQHAKAVATAILSDGIASVAKSLGDAFGWSHPLWDTGVTDGSDISVNYPERHQGNTVRWLFLSVLPAIKKLIASGEADSVQYFTKLILDELPIEF